MTSQEKLFTAWSVFVVVRGVKGQTKAILDLGVSKGALQRFRKQFRLITGDIISEKLEDSKIQRLKNLNGKGREITLKIRTLLNGAKMQMINMSLS
ncbi:MAG: hypothetical protein QNL02_20390 [Paracoccaceae bacterium]|jgi:hypothetical protein